MHTCSLIPRPNTTTIGLGMRLVHKRNRELTMRRVGTVSSVVVGKVYEQGLWNGTMEWKMEWNSEHTQLQLTLELTRVSGTTQSRLMYL